MSPKYKGKALSQISFPLGGIGTGSIGLAGNGRLIDWEIFNRPNKESYNGFSHFAVKAVKDGKVVDARVLNGDLQPHYIGDPFQAGYTRGYGYGPACASLAGMPHFESATFTGEFPVASIKFKDKAFPGTVRLKAFNPFIPRNDKDSSLPAAMFELSVKNTSKQALDYTFQLAVTNPFEDCFNKYLCEGPYPAIFLSSASLISTEAGYGDMTVMTDAKDVSYQEYWQRGSCFDNLQTYWREFAGASPLENRQYIKPGKNDTCTLAAHIKVGAGETGRVRFLLSWNVPNMYMYWADGHDWCSEYDAQAAPMWKNYYATQWKDSTESAGYAMRQWDRLYGETNRFRRALFSSSLPEPVLDAVASNLSTLKSPTCLRLTNGTFYGFEGVQKKKGCCEGSCTHVWNYAYALPFLFPTLERSMRDADYQYNMDEAGGMRFRLQLPLGSGRSEFRPCADGQFGGIYKVYRDWKISGDSDWLRCIWPKVKKALAYAWSPQNCDRWDPERTGVLSGRQHHTLDMELFGESSWLAGFYLLALTCAAQMARFLGDEDAGMYEDMFERGREFVNRNLFNGSYFIQRIDLTDRSVLEPYAAGDPAIFDTYWNEQSGEIKYQIGGGCMIDQMLAQWHAAIAGAGEIYDRDKAELALRAVYRNNFKKSMRSVVNPCRIFAVNDEAGAIICDWSEAAARPAIPVPYAEECFTGCEYQAAAQMIGQGMVDEGLELVKAVRARYDGEKRNPYNEFECGSNYARAMASYSLLCALSGFEFDMAAGHLGFRPKVNQNHFSCVWSLGPAWGEVKADRDRIEVRVHGGKLTLKSFACDLPHGAARVLAGEEEIGFACAGDRLLFDRTAVVEAGQSLMILKQGRVDL